MAENQHHLYLKGCAAIYVAHDILDMEKNGLVIKDKEFSAYDVNAKPEDRKNIEKGIRDITKICVAIVNRVKLPQKDRLRVANMAQESVSSFFSSGILKEGISPHIAYVCVLYNYFTQLYDVKHSIAFSKLTDPNRYLDVFGWVESADNVAWKRHMDAAEMAAKTIAVWKL